MRIIPTIAKQVFFVNLILIVIEKIIFYYLRQSPYKHVEAMVSGWYHRFRNDPCPFSVFKMLDYLSPSPSNYNVNDDIDRQQSEPKNPLSTWLFNCLIADGKDTFPKVQGNFDWGEHLGFATPPLILPETSAPVHLEDQKESSNDERM